ncbi:hypothetical protein IJG22_02440 [Candidatus Saccharibacteria bacterium]|nr:hypothetical protein [Candidatus Saccharibacteria bacterium]
MRNTVEQRLAAIENELKALKGVYAISGSQIPFVAQESPKYSRVAGENTHNGTFEFTFTPSKIADQNLLTEFYVVLAVARSITIDGTTHTEPTTTIMRRLAGDVDVNGKFKFKITHEYYPTSSGQTYSMSAYAITCGPAEGTFSCEITIV